MGITRAEATVEVRQSNEKQKPALMKLITELPEKGQPVPVLLEHAEAGEAVGLLVEELKSRQGDATMVAKLQDDLQRETKKRKAEIRSLQRDCRKMRRSISEAVKVGTDLADKSSQNLSVFEKMLFNEGTGDLLAAFLKSRECHQVSSLLKNSTRELDCQLGYNKLFETFAALVPIGKRFFSCADTSDGGIPHTRSKPDLIIIEGAIAKPHIGAVIEIKWKFEKDQAYNHAVGQRSDRTAEFDRSQPRRRKWVHAVADRREVEFWLMSLDSDNDESSGKLPLFCSKTGEFIAEGYALRFLAGLLLADPKAIHYHPVDIPSKTSLQDGRDVVFLHLVDSIKKKEDSEEDDEERRSYVQIYKVQVDEEELIVKLPGNYNCDQEAAVLRQLAEIEELKDKIVELEDVILVRDVEKGLLLRPAGTLIDYDSSSFDQRFQYIRQLVHVVDILGQNGYIHGDISYWNVILHAELIRLIDFRTCRKLEGTDIEFLRTGTTAFMALQTIVSNCQDVRTELECCFMLLLFLLLRGESPWAEGNLDAAVNRRARRAIFCTVDGWDEILAEIPDEEAASKITTLKELFYPRGRYDLAGVSVDAFLSCI